MADHNKPVTTDNYVDVLAHVRDVADDQAQMFDPATTSPTNLPAGAIRWSSAIDQFQKWSGSTWSLLTSTIKMAFAAPSPCSIAANSTDPALRITQTGAGNCLVIEDSASPDSTPFVVDSEGRVGVGASAIASAKLLTSDDTLANIVNRSASSSGAVVIGQRSTGTVASPTIVASGNVLGTLRFDGYDGAAYIASAQISASVDAAPGTGDMPGRLVFFTTADGASTPTEAMRIDSSQRVRDLAGVAQTPTRSTVDTGSTITLTNATSHLLYDQAATIAALTVTLPSAGIVDGQIITIATRSAKMICMRCSAGIARIVSRTSGASRNTRCTSCW
jgi:hypothetical protein